MKGITDLAEARRRIANLESSQIELRRKAALRDSGKESGTVEAYWKTFRQGYFSRLLENLPERVFFKDRHSVYVSCNQNYARDLGIELSEIAGKTDYAFFPKDLAGKLIADDQRIMELGDSEDVEQQYVTKDGRESIVYMVRIPIKDESGSPVGILGILLDNTDRKRARRALKSYRDDLKGVVPTCTAELRKAKQQLEKAIKVRKRTEEALWESETRYRTVLEGSPDPIVVYDMEGKVLHLNPAFTRIFGWTMKELFGKRIDYVPRENWPETRLMISRVLAGESFSGIESRRYTKEGKVLDVSISAATYENCEGVPAGSVITLRDITQGKRLEAQLQQAQKMNAIGTLAGGIAHDFNNVLMGIQGHASLVSLETDPGHPHLEHLKGIRAMVQRGAELTKQLLAFARGGQCEAKPTDLNELIEKAFEMFGRTKKEIRLYKRYQKEVWPVEVNQGQIQQVLLNLYVNAWQAMPNGGALHIATNNVVLDESLTRPFGVIPGNYVRVSVTDTGIGMDRAVQERIFEPFFTTKDKDCGTGLGLASTYWIIKNHGGIISVYSKKGEGTTFNICIPASERKVAVEVEKLSHEIVKGTGTILLVEDENEILAVSEEMLKQMGYKVYRARSGKEAQEVFMRHQHEIDLAILNMIMPGMHGGEVYDRLKQINPAVKTLLVSGYNLHGLANEILQRGCDGFLQKPFNVEELSSRLRQILDKNTGTVRGEI